MARRRRHPLLFAALAILFLGAGTAATLLVRPGGPLAGTPPVEDPREAASRRAAQVHPTTEFLRSHLRPATLRVRVRRDADGTPVPGALVVVSGGTGDLNTIASEDGGALVTGLVEGHAAVRAEADGLGGAPVRAFLKPGPNGPVEVRLSAVFRVAGRVVADEDGTPVAGATVILLGDGAIGSDGSLRAGVPRPPAGVATAVDGTFAFPDARAGAHLQAIASGFEPNQVEVREGQEAEIRLVRGGRLRGTVKREDGSPVAGVKVAVEGWPTRVRVGAVSIRVGEGGAPAVFYPAHLLPSSAVTGPDGTWVLEGQPRGAEVTLSARGNGFLLVGGVAQALVPADGSDGVVDLVVAEAGWVVVKWVGQETGNRWHARLVRLPKAPGPEWSQGAGGNPPGGLKFGPLPPGRYEATASGDAGIGEAEVVVLPGATAVVEIGPMAPGDPREGPVLAGEVVDGNGLPLAGARVEVLTGAEASEDGSPTAFQRAALSRISSFTSDSLGRFRIRVADPGSFWVRATAPGRGPGAAGPFTPPVEGLRIVVDATGTVEGRIQPLAGAPFPKELVLGFRCAPEPGAAAAAVALEPVHRSTTGFRDGRFRLPGLPAGRGFLIGTADGLPFGPVEVTVPAGGVVDVGTVEMRAPRSVQGRVVDGAGRPVESATVFVSSAIPGYPADWTGPDGTFLLEGIPTEEVVLKVRRPPTASAGHPMGALILPAAPRVIRREDPLLVPVPAGGDVDLGDVVLPSTPPR